MTCTGYYIDIDDVIILLNEANVEPIPYEVGIIEDLVEVSNVSGHIDCLQDILDAYPFHLPCLDYGARVINNKKKVKNMKTTEYEVEFDKYCKNCKFADTPEVNDPCNECLNQCWNEETRKPIHYISAIDEKNKGYSST